MKVNNFLENADYNPAALLDSVIDDKKLRNDSNLARMLGVGAPAICKMRSKQTQITADLLIRMHDATGRSLDDLRATGGIPKTKSAQLATGSQHA